MTNQATKLESLMNGTQSSVQPKKHTQIITITSGKGGVGKSTISANLANILAKNAYKVGLFDADIGLANLDVILNVNLSKTLLQVLRGECALEDILLKIKENLWLIPGDSGDEILRYNNDKNIYERFLTQAKILDELDFLIIDTGAGIGGTAHHFLEMADALIIVTVPEPAAITDAYAVIKLVSKSRDNAFLLLNCVKNEKEAKLVFDNLNEVARNNIKNPINLNLLGHLCASADIKNATKKRSLFSDDNTSANDELTALASALLSHFNQNTLGKNPNNITKMFKKMMEKFA